MKARTVAAAILACALAVLPAASQTRAPVAPLGPPATPPATAAATPDGTPALTATDLSAWLDGFVPTTLRAGKIAGAQVVVVKDGAVLVTKGYGYADVARRVPMNPDRTLMRIGSTSKLFTWTAVMQLVDAGRIDLNADVNRYLDFRIMPRRGARAITMNDLMTHRAGFEEGLKDVLADDPARLLTTEQYLKRNPRPMLFAPGEAPAYSNYGVALAGYIVQRVSGEPFEAYVERHIFQPLGMAHTSFRQPLPPALARDAALGYPNSDAPAAKFELVETAPAGSASATGSDMAKFMLAHLNGGPPLLKPQTEQLMRTPQLAAPAGFDTMAHGFFREERNGRLVLGHGGDTIVFHTDLAIMPGENVGIFMSFNSRGVDDAVYGARERLFDLFLDRYFPAPAAPTPPAIAGAAADAAALAGAYESSRRVEHGFISLFYLLQQDHVSANADGTISLASIPDTRFGEVAKGRWRAVDGTRQLIVTTVDGRLTLVDSNNPAGIEQAVPLWRNAQLFQLLAGFALLTLLAVTLAWPLGAWLRRKHGVPRETDRRLVRARRWARIGAIADLGYLAAWYVVLAPVMSLALWHYNAGLDATVRVLQLAAIVPLLAACAGIWNVWAAVRAQAGWGAIVRAVLLALALLVLVWVAWMGGLIGWSLNY